MPCFLRFREAVFILCGAVFFAAAAFAQEATPRRPDIRVNVDRVNVGVVVTDSRDQFVPGLQRSDFRLFDDGVEQPITDFLNIDEPAQVLLLVEAGPAVYFLQSGHLQAVQTLLDGLAPGDRVALARYDEHAERILDWVADKRVAAGALDQLRFNLGFGQLNLASSLLTALDWLARVPGKKSLVLMSTGVDTSPAKAVEQVLLGLRTTDARVVAISLGGDMRDVGNPPKKPQKKNQPLDPKVQATMEGLARADQELTAIAEANGSRAFFPKNNKEFARAFTEISQLIRHEYSLGFSPPSCDGRIHTIEVKVSASAGREQSMVANSSWRVDHRKAYIAPTSENE